jgi:beta-glucosidase/6-phospho-beta-glucosidase/beta-galactosidase
MPGFMFATGIENSYPTISVNGSTVRVDQMESSHFYERWREDFALLDELGIEFLRYGPPLYRSHAGPGKYDWSWSDEHLEALKEQNVRPILDLCHFGVPDWVGNFQNPDWPDLFAEYAGAFAHRYPWVQLYTPVNEIYVAATFSAQFGWWNECLASDRSFVNALRNLCMANMKAMHAILQAQPHAVFVQSESSEYFHAEDPQCMITAEFLNEKRFLPLDLTYGQAVSGTMFEYLMDNGFPKADLHWLKRHHVKSRCIMGNDYYATNEHLVQANDEVVSSGEIFGYYVITEQYYERYRLPVMHTETNYHDPDAVGWLKKEWANMHRLKQDGVPVLGFTWFSLIDQVDWDTQLREKNNRVNPVGLYDMDRKIRDVGVAYKRLIEVWRHILPTESTVLGICL